ncbi:hypothetical protein CTA2_9764 [Colletotrichum tanaceti]|uniref:Uncharacterized protein n=1 Tax=Colletotrichum tanaceti TaxID=1306861 RepID=A0A4U6X0R3_9PEZI|nr:hypothetical protein CTA2_9764 [Colletotrichum tanaceti]TKW48930.1 hypothetical protein CTA1_10820 [Colletotrichum tanaceti]
MQTSQTVPIHRWLLTGGAVRDVVVGRLADAKLAGDFWGRHGFLVLHGAVNLAFTETLLWFKGKLA